MQNYLVFQPINRYYKRVVGVCPGKSIYYWKSKELPDERINSVRTSDYEITPYVGYYGTKTRIEFNESCLKEDKITYTHGKVINIYLVYEIVAGYSEDDYYPAFQNALFGAVKLIKNADTYKYGYSGYGTGFGRRSSFSFPGGEFGQNVIIFGADMSLSTKIYNRKKDILITGKGPMQGLEHTVTAEKNVFT